MANKIRTSTSAASSSLNFDPPSELRSEGGLESLVFYLPEFKKHQLRVQVNKDGVLKVSGERPTSADGTKKIHFLKETKIPEGCNINEIRAKFTDGSLHITMPKKVTPAAPQVMQQQQPASASSTPPQPEENNQKPEADAALISDENKAKGTTNAGKNGEMEETSESYDHPKVDHMFEYGSIIQRLQGRKKVALGFGIAFATMVAIGAFVAYKYGSNSISSAPYMDEPELI